MKKTDEFVTSDGNKIPFNLDYLEYAKEVIGLPETVSPDYQFASANVAGGNEILDYDKAKELGSSVERLSNSGYGARWQSVHLLKSLLEDAGIHNRFRTMLDIGCGYALQPRLLKSLDLVEHCSAIDLYDRASTIDESYLTRQHRRMRWFGMIDKVQSRILRKPYGQMSDMERAVLYKINTPRRAMRASAGYLPSQEIFSTRLRKKPHLDELIIGNVFDVQRQFELVTAFSAVEWFKKEEIFAKISEMTEDGGIFYLYVANYWHAVTAGRIFGHFPFVAQRLKIEDFKRYLTTYFPDQAVAWQSAYDFFDPSHPTVHDYVDCAAQYGLYPIAQFSPVASGAYSHKYGVTTRGWLELEPSAVESALSDIQGKRPDIRMTDLLPLTHHVLFRKVDRARKATKPDFDALKAPFQDFRYRPTNPVLKGVRNIGKRFIYGR